MRRKRRKYTWLPILGAERGSGPEANAFVTQQYIEIQTPFGSPFPAGFVLPLLGDEGEEEANNTEAPLFINDALGQEYVLERVVGTIHVACQQLLGAPSAMTVTAGIFVAPKDSNNSNLALGDGVTSPYSPMWRVNCDQPWMWRRTWIVGNLIASGSASFGPFPPTNVDATETTGPAVDIRSVRRVHKDERLWIAVAAMPTYVDDVGSTEDAKVRVSWDLRALGAMRRAKNSSTFRA